MRLPNPENYSPTLPATDALGRKLPTHAEIPKLLGIIAALFAPLFAKCTAQQDIIAYLNRDVAPDGRFNFIDTINN